MKVIEHLVEAVRAAAAYDPRSQAAPACILWTDGERHWEPVMAQVAPAMPELFVLGKHEPASRRGPALWLRCAIAGALPDAPVPEGRVPVLYLPAVSRAQLRDVAGCPEELRLLVELQYRGVIWSHENGRDFTPLAFLKTGSRGGLGLDVAEDARTREALRMALPRLLEEDVQQLAGRRIDAAFLHALNLGDDAVGELLRWIGNPDGFQADHGTDAWRSFVELAKKQFGIDPEKDGVLAAAERLARHEKGEWKKAWKRYVQAPQAFAGIEAQIRRCRMPAFGMLPEAEETEGWPQYDDERELEAKRELEKALSGSVEELRQAVLRLESQHAHRQNTVWAGLGMARLACALGPLAVLAEKTGRELPGTGTQRLAQSYREQGADADAALVQALAKARDDETFSLVSRVAGRLYSGWADAAARALQEAWRREFAGRSPEKAPERAPAGCILFVDGLRYDCARELARRLEGEGFAVALRERWAPLPSVTGTGKPAAAPGVRGSSRLAENAQPYNGFDAMTNYQLQQAIAEAGYAVKNSRGEVAASSLDGGKLWMEFDGIDREGHERQARLAWGLGEILERIAAQVKRLLEHWEAVDVVTDHGWLLVPGGLPKSRLEVESVQERWGRCARIREDARSSEHLYPWEWNPQVWVALPEGISGYAAGQEYAHGGLSLQECRLLEMTVSRKAGGGGVRLAGVQWKRLVARVQLEGKADGCRIDIRKQPGDAASSLLADGAVPPGDKGTARLVVEDEDQEGEKAWVVLLDEAGAPLGQMETIIGGGEA